MHSTPELADYSNQWIERLSSVHADVLWIFRESARLG